MAKTMLSIEGHRYHGLFDLEEHMQTGSERVNTEVGYYNRQYTSHYWEGGALVRDKQTGDEQKFLIWASGNKESNLIFTDMYDRNQILKMFPDYRKIVDFALQEMFETAKQSGDIVPRIIPPNITLEKLLKSDRQQTLSQ